MKSPILVSNIPSLENSETNQLPNRNNRFYIYNTEPENLHYSVISKSGSYVTFVFKNGLQHTCKVNSEIYQEDFEDGDVLLESDMLCFATLEGETVGLSWKNINMVTVSQTDDGFELLIAFNAIGLSDLRSCKRFNVSQKTLTNINKYCKAMG
jgi:hypothetical protein